MADPTTQAVEAAPIPDPTLVARAEAFTHERFIHEGEDASVALAPGSARRRALDAAVAEIDAGAKVPSTKWRRRYALLLGLEPGRAPARRRQDAAQPASGRRALGHARGAAGLDPEGRRRR
jgi:hypothetical protein